MSLPPPRDAVSRTGSASALAPLQVPRTSMYQHGPSASIRMGVLSPGRGLKHIDRIEIKQYVERSGVVYYIVDVFMRKPDFGKASSAPRVVGVRSLDSFNGDVLIDVDLNNTPTFQIERRYSDFEALRHKLSVCFENLHTGSCHYCDTFTSFLSCSTIQPGLLTKLTTRPPQRTSILANFLNQAIALALSNPEDAVHGACDGGSIIPRVLESFLGESRSLFNFAMDDA